MKNVFVITSNVPKCDNPDQKSEPSQYALDASNKLKKMGIPVSVIGVGKDVDQFCEDLALTPSLCFKVSKYADLSNIKDQLMKSSCVGLKSFETNCDGDTGKVKYFINGVGFKDFGLDGQCQFIVNKTGVQVTYHTPTKYHCSEKIECLMKDSKSTFPDDGYDVDEYYHIDVSFDGTKYTHLGMQAKVETVKCDKTTVNWVLFGIIVGAAILLMLAICVCCICVCIICGVSGYLAFRGKKGKDENYVPLPDDTVVNSKKEEVPEIKVVESTPLLNEEPKKKLTKKELFGDTGPGKRYSSQYFVGGKAIGIDWGQKGIASHQRAGTMGMGDNFGYNKKERVDYNPEDDDGDNEERKASEIEEERKAKMREEIQKRREANRLKREKEAEQAAVEKINLAEELQKRKEERERKLREAQEADGENDDDDE